MPPIQDDIWAHRFIVAALFMILGAVYAFNATNGTEPDIPTDLLAGLLGAVIAYYFKRGNGEGK